MLVNMANEKRPEHQIYDRLVKDIVSIDEQKKFYKKKIGKLQTSLEHLEEARKTKIFLFGQDESTKLIRDARRRGGGGGLLTFWVAVIVGSYLLFFLLSIINPVHWDLSPNGELVLLSVLYTAIVSPIITILFVNVIQKLFINKMLDQDMAKTKDMIKVARKNLNILEEDNSGLY